MSVIKFYSKNAAENPDNVLEQAIGVYKSVLILGFDHNGEFDPRASLNLDAEEMVYMIEKFKHKLLSGDYEEE